MSWKLKRTKQCAKCPWKVSTDPTQIPHGYSRELHRQLSVTIADGSESFAVAIGNKAFHAMACHEHPIGDEAHCVGWLMNQLGPGNNIRMRLSALSCENIDKVVLDGDQHLRFEDTIPPVD